MGGLKKKRTSEIKSISYSLHGEPEGILLKDGAAVKIPPHTVLHEEFFVLGAPVEVVGEEVTTEGLSTLHRARVRSHGRLIASTPSTKEIEERIKESHRKHLRHLEKNLASLHSTEVEGTIAGISHRPKGETELFFLEDGVSVHIPRGLELRDHFEVGDEVAIQAEERIFGDHRFLKANEVRKRSKDSELLSSP